LIEELVTSVVHDSPNNLIYRGFVLREQMYKLPRLRCIQVLDELIPQDNVTSVLRADVKWVIAYVASGGPFHSERTIAWLKKTIFNASERYTPSAVYGTLLSRNTCTTRGLALVAFSMGELSAADAAYIRSFFECDDADLKCTALEICERRGLAEKNVLEKAARMIALESTEAKPARRACEVLQFLAIGNDNEVKERRESLDFEDALERDYEVKRIRVLFETIPSWGKGLQSKLLDKCEAWKILAATNGNSR
jgi:hypothetical protein